MSSKSIKKSACDIQESFRKNPPKSTVLFRKDSLKTSLLNSSKSTQLLAVHTFDSSKSAFVAPNRSSSFSALTVLKKKLFNTYYGALKKDIPKSTIKTPTVLKISKMFPGVFQKNILEKSKVLQKIKLVQPIPDCGPNISSENILKKSKL